MSGKRTTIHRADRGVNNYFYMRRATAQDSQISFEARGVLAYLLSKPNDWTISPQDLMREGGCGRERIYRILKELLKHGYLEREKQPHVEEEGGERGRFLPGSYLLHEDPHTEKPHAAQPHTVNPSHTYKENKTNEEREREKRQPAAESKQEPPADSPALSSEAVTDDLDLIGAWRDALPVKPLVTTYAGEASRLQELLIDDGITAADVRAYVAAQYDPDTSDGFWFGKSMSFKHVAGHVREWKIGEVLKKQAVKVAPSLSPADPDCPMCDGQGVYSYDVPYGDPRFGKTEVCACRKPGTQEAAA